MTNRNEKIIICALLAAAAGVLYARTLGYGFINFDDIVYIRDNYRAHGLSLRALRWAFTSTYDGNWYPLTWLSLMLDFELWGQDAGGYHLTNLALHAASSVLLFLAFNRMTGRLRQSAFVAAVFALHPLHVESVVWIAERKDVLSGLFWMLAMYAYAGYAEKRTPWRYALVFALMGLGLMSKAMLVTLPFVFLLLDVWPLGRMGRGWRGAAAPVVEKIPLFALSAASSVIAYSAQHRVGAMAGFERLPLTPRLANSIVSYAAYAVKTVYPSKLAVFYPLSPGGPALREVIAAAIFIALVSALSLWAMRKRPFLFTGWFWFIGALVPVIGLVQVGSQARADRYMYLPVVGLSIIAAWGAPELLNNWRRKGPALAAAALVYLSALAVCAYAQAGYWSSSVTLFEHALAVTENNHMAHHRLAVALAEEGRLEEAVEHNLQALRIMPGFAGAYSVIKFHLAELELFPGEAAYVVDTHNALGDIFAGRANVEKAVFHYTEAVRVGPEHVPALISLGVLYGRGGSYDAAIEMFTRVAALEPVNPLAYYNMGLAYERKGMTDEAVRNYGKALELRPDYAEPTARLKAIDRAAQ